MPEPTTEQLSIKVSSERMIREVATSVSPGRLFWEKLSPEKQTILVGPLRKAEETIAQRFPDGFTSRHVENARALKDANQLEHQQNETSCTYVSTANAMRVLDKPEVAYSKQRLESTLRRIVGGDRLTIGDQDIVSILKSGPPYNQFSLAETVASPVSIPGYSSEMAGFFDLLQNGAVAVGSWYKFADRVSTSAGIVEHARTIVGFSKGVHDTLFLHVIDPYGAQPETWSFRDWVVASNMTVLDEADLGVDFVKNKVAKLTKREGTLSEMVDNLWILQKKQPRVVISTALPTAHVARSIKI